MKSISKDAAPKNGLAPTKKAKPKSKRTAKKKERAETHARLRGMQPDMFE